MHNFSLKDCHIVVVDDDPFFIDYVSESLNEANLYTCLDGQIISDTNIIASSDLIILDIDLNGKSGFSLCEKARAINPTVPILFISGLSDLESRLTAYGSGGNDYIAKPFQHEELQYKVFSLMGLYRETKDLNSRLTMHSQVIKDTQIDLANIQVINRFVVASMQCRDENALNTVFFHTLRELNTEGVIKISKAHPSSSCGEITRLEHEIMTMSEQLPRVYTFGKNRAFFNWKNCQLLVRNIGGLIDIIAMLMDSLEICINKLQYEKQLIEQIDTINQYNEIGQETVSDMLLNMVEDISERLMTLGLISSLEPEEEQQIQKVLHDYRQEIGKCFEEQTIYNHRLKGIIDEMRTASPEFQLFIDSIVNNSGQSDAVELF